MLYRITVDSINPLRLLAANALKGNPDPSNMDDWGDEIDWPSNKDFSKMKLREGQVFLYEEGYVSDVTKSSKDHVKKLYNDLLNP